ncbi:MAG: hypothetical protein OEO79_08900 [Gemmatimonadota bacterium]|nr:hypothetical protein [Gemmatimonadota bacterium]MDH3422676.1 hypothetical protein [Gemmatimonadota bacterium]
MTRARSSRHVSSHSPLRKIAGCVLLAVLAGTYGCTEEPNRTLRPNGDLLATGNDVRVADSVSGDAMLAGQVLDFDGFAGGSYLGAGRAQTIAGRVLGSVRAAGATIEVDALVGRNATLAGGRVVVRDDAEIGGNAYLAGGTVRLDGTVSGDVYVGAGEFVLDGEVGGDVRVEAGTLRLGPDARVFGELRYRLPEDETPALSEEAVVARGVVALAPRPDEPTGGIGFFVFRLIAFVLSAAIVVALLPGPTARMVGELQRHPGAALGTGLLWLILVPMAVLICAITVVGIPLAAMVAALYGISLYLAPVVPALWVGGEFLKGRNPTARKDAVLLGVTGGAVVAFAILLPWIGWLARLLSTCAGLGAAVLFLRRRGHLTEAAS